MSKNPNENKFEFVDRKLLPIVSISSIIASVLVVVTSAVKAYLYSSYFGIGMSNFDYISTTKEMVVCVGPFLLVVLTLLYFRSYNRERIMVKDSVERFIEILFLFLHIAFIDVSVYIFLVTEKAFNLSKHIKLILIICSIIILLFGVCEIFVFSRKEKDKKSDINAICDYAVSFIVVFFIGLALFPNIVIRCMPSFIEELEIAKAEDKTYAIICDYSESKIAMDCSISDDKTEIVIHYGKYKFIDPKDYTFEYMTFKYVSRDIDNPLKITG